LQNRYDSKIEEFPYFFSSLSAKVDLREREGMMKSSGLEIEVCVVHFK